MHRLLLASTVACMVAPAWAQAPPGPALDGTLQEKMQRLERGLRALGPWEQQYAATFAAAQRIYERNGWDSEPDRFSLWLLSQVEQIPPWDFPRRLERLTEALGERYTMDADQRELLRSTLTREVLGLMARHAPRMLEYGVELVETRARGDPITAEQVARWTRLAEPVFHDARQRLENVAAELMSELRPDQQEIVKLDLQAAWRRLDRIDELQREWSQGRWTAADWGLDGDPIQMAGEDRLARNGSTSTDRIAAPPANGPSTVHPSANGPGSQLTPRPVVASPTLPVRSGGDGTPEGARKVSASPAPQDLPPGSVPASGATAVTDGSAGHPAPAGSDSTPPPPPAVSHPPVVDPRASRAAAPGATPAEEDDDWWRYTRAFIDHYRLNEEQQQQAWRVYREARERREQVQSRWAPQIRAAETRAQARDADAAAARSLADLQARRSAAVERVFDEMKGRLERIPTRAQRRSAGPGEIRIGPSGRPATRPARRP